MDAQATALTVLYEQLAARNAELLQLPARYVELTKYSSRVSHKVRLELPRQMI